MVITCFVGGSLTAYSAIRWAHQALVDSRHDPDRDLPRSSSRTACTLSPASTALFFCVAIVYYSVKLTRHLEERFRLAGRARGPAQDHGRG